MLDSGMLKQAMSAGVLALELAVITLAALAAGNLVDKRLETSPLFILLCTATGFSIACYRIFRHLKTQDNHDADPQDPS